MKFRKPLSQLPLLIYYFIVVLVSFTFMELSFEMLLRTPKFIPSKLLPYIKEYYMYHDRNIIQYNKKFSKYDNTVYYKLYPGHFRFSNREFDVVFDVNEFGLRDDSASLKNPEIILLGDSYTMGWGVDQDHTFASLIEDKLNYKTLNAGMSSYGTARELTLLRQLNTDSLKYLIIQYCSNDYWENKVYFNDNNEIQISNMDSYLTVCNNHKNAIKYYPFKHIFTFSGMIGQKLKNKIRKPKNRDSILLSSDIDEYSAFLNVMDSINNLIPAQTKIIVFSVEVLTSRKNFIKGLENKLQDQCYDQIRKRIVLLNLSSSLDKQHYFILDDHINKAGHQAIAEMLSTIME